MTNDHLEDYLHILLANELAQPHTDLQEDLPSSLDSPS
ncbi:hypothetical protein Mpsy_0250 [Methanolobus psychrophilus R15]|nr:hypothetical protein Mpsy_0250 [Methanolobus psychrophilus R15]